MTKDQETWFTGLFFLSALFMGIILSNIFTVQSQLNTMKPSPNEYRGHIYGNKLSMPKRELDIVTGIIRHDPKYDSAVLMQEGK